MVNNFDLNEAQKEAICHPGGPVLILAGAGSGKTRVLTHRVAYLISEKKVHPENILALTFTNKAAGEMKERVWKQVSNSPPSWVCTFHSACARILRRNIDNLGYDKNFLIYDTRDKNALIKECAGELNLDTSRYKPAAVANIISNMKNRVGDSNSDETTPAEESYYWKNIQEIKELYQTRLKKNNAVDFDDLLLLTLQLFKESGQILEYYQYKFRHILVDEFQDTNQVQYELIKMLAPPENNLFVVGDDDQSIYLFRGADVRNILYFERDFSSCSVIKLEKNYRSTINILEAANRIAENNPRRNPKELWSDNDRGEKIKFFCAGDEIEEARFIARQIKDNMDKYSSMAVLYRTNAQSRAIEDALIWEDIDYKIVGTSFYDRKEVKDILAYLMVIENPQADLQLERIINEPKRGIGKTSFQKVKDYAVNNEISLYEALLESKNIGLGSKAVKAIETFTEMISNFRKKREYLSVKELIQEVAEESGYMSSLEKLKEAEARDRIENVKEFYSMAQEFQSEGGETLLEFLLNLSLITDLDKLDEEEAKDEGQVVLMTLHGAKGLEFSVVFLTGMEEEIFPHVRSFNSYEELEEERRLCYVGITRAEELLYLTRAENRTIYGMNRSFLPSRFLQEIDEELIEDLSSVQGGVNLSSFETSYPAKSPAVNPGSFLTSSKSKNNEKIEANNTGYEFYQEGELLNHKKWGKGKIIEAQEISEDWILTVEFESGETKKLAAALAPIEKI